MHMTIGACEPEQQTVLVLQPEFCAACHPDTSGSPPGSWPPRFRSGGPFFHNLRPVMIAGVANTHISDIVLLADGGALVTRLHESPILRPHLCRCGSHQPCLELVRVDQIYLEFR